MAFLTLENLSKSYYKKHPGFKNINLTLDTGQLVALIGPNGCGKTSLLKSIAGLLTPDEGRILIQGDEALGEKKERLVFQPDTTILPLWKKVDDVVDEYKSFFQGFDEQKARNLIQSLDIPLSKRIKELSHGMVDKVQIVLDLCRDADIYLFDEPIAAVDPASREVILDLILEHFDRSALMILSTHLISEIETIFDRVIFMDQGELLEVIDVDELRRREGCSVNDYFRRLYAKRIEGQNKSYVGPGL